MERKSPSGSRLLKLVDACPRLGCRPQTAYNAISSGEGEISKLPFYRIGRSIRIAEDDLERFLAARRVEPGGAA